MAEFKDEEMKEVNGGQWQPAYCHGWVLYNTTHMGRTCYYYQIGSGDTLSQIEQSLRGDQDWAGLAAFNNIANPQLIYPGNCVYVPLAGIPY